MEVIYKVVNIEGKGSGCVALQDLKKGTLVLDEKPQCVAKKHPDGSRDLKSVIQSFAHMSKNDQEEYLKLYMQYQNLVEVPDSWKIIYSLLDSETEKNLDSSNGVISEFVHNFMEEKQKGYQRFVDIIGIYNTNCFENGLGIKTARFNHSCCSNANAYWNKEDNKTEIRVVSKIKAGHSALKFEKECNFEILH